MSPFVSLYLAPVVSQPGRLSRLSGVEGFICLPLSPFICLPLSPSLDAWHGSLGGRVHLSPFVSLHLAPLVSQPGCLSRLSKRTDSLVSLGSPSFISHLVGGRIDLSPFVASLGGRIHLSPFVSLCLSPVVSQPGCSSGWTDSFVSRCLPAWMCGTHAPRFPSLPANLSFWRGLVCLRLRPWLRSFLVLWMLGTGSSVCPSSGLRFCLGSWWVVFLVYRWLHPVCSFSASLSVAASLCPCSHLESRADESGALRRTASATRRLC